MRYFVTYSTDHTAGNFYGEPFDVKSKAQQACAIAACAIAQQQAIDYGLRRFDFVVRQFASVKDAGAWADAQHFNA